MRTCIAIILVLMLNQMEAIGQNSIHTLTTQYTINFPFGNTNDFISKTSFRGFTMDYRNHMMPEVAIGISVGWYAFYERKPDDTYSMNDDALTFSGKQYRYLNSVPMLFVVDYYKNPEEVLSPFAGLGIGTTYNRVDLEMGLYDVQIDSWHFTLAPEAGFRFGYDMGVSGYISARYNINFKTGELDSQSYLSLNIGLMYR